MNDLNAPLGMNSGRKSPQAKRSADAAPKSSLVGAGLFLAALLCTNLLVLFSDEKPMTSIVKLAEPAMEQAIVATVTPGEAAQKDADETPPVAVIYGSNIDKDLAQNDTADLPVPLPRGSVIDVSPGGARIITVRDPTMVEIGQPLPQAHLPHQPALEESEQGPLPKIGKDGRRPVDIYARPWSSARGKRIALVIGGLGLSQTGTKRALDSLPPEITLAFAPTGFSLDRWMQVARKKGHELLVQVPMEPFNYPEVNPGPNTLRLASSAQTNLDNLHWAMGRITNYTGIVNYLGARFVADQAAMDPVFKDLSERGLLYFNDGSNGASVNLGKRAALANVPYVSSNLTIDTANDAGSIRAKLKALEGIAEARGDAIGFGSALALTITEVSQWANEAKKNGFELVGVAAIARGSQEN